MHSLIPGLLIAFTLLIEPKLSSSFLLHILKETVFSTRFQACPLVFPFFSFSLPLSLLPPPSQGIHFTLIVWQSFPAFMPRLQKVQRVFFSSFFEALITFRSTDSPGHNLIMAYRQKKQTVCTAWQLFSLLFSEKWGVGVKCLLVKQSSCC